MHSSPVSVTTPVEQPARPIHILVVDDDRELGTLVAQSLGGGAMRVTTVRDGGAMYDVLEREDVDLVVLDLMLPGIDGLTLCRQIKEGPNLPVIILSARGNETDRVVGLEIGADDYLSKPFSVRELEARIKSVLRRAGRQGPAAEPGERPKELRFVGWTLDFERHRLLSPEGALVDLTWGEFELLAVLAARPQRVLSRDQLVDLAKGRNAAPFDRSIDVQISRLRRKLETDPRNPQIIRTMRNGGYYFSPPVERP